MNVRQNPLGASQFLLQVDLVFTPLRIENAAGNVCNIQRTGAWGGCHTYSYRESPRGVEGFFWAIYIPPIRAF